MELPISLKQLIEENALTLKQKSLASAAASISDKYRAENIDGGRAVTSTEETAAYSVVRMPATFGAVSAALQYAASYCDEEIASVLDAGAGTGAAAWAAAEVFDAEKVICAEREREMIRLGSSLMENGDFPAEYEWYSCDITADELPCRADLVTASYVLNELKADAHAGAVEKLWKSADKMLVIIEPGTMKGFRSIMTAREKLLSLGAHIAAPCPHEEKCPLGKDDWCHFTARISRTKLHKQLKNADVPYEDEKFCYIAAVRTDGGRCKARVLRHPTIESGKITLDLCTSDGLMQRLVTKKDGALFKKARKSECGDAFGE